MVHTSWYSSARVTVFAMPAEFRTDVLPGERRCYRSARGKPEFNAYEVIAGFPLLAIRRAISWVGVMDDRDDIKTVAESLGCPYPQAERVLEALERRGFVSRTKVPRQWENTEFARQLRHWQPPPSVRYQGGSAPNTSARATVDHASTAMVGAKRATPRQLAALAGGFNLDATPISCRNGLRATLGWLAHSGERLPVPESMSLD